MIAFKLMAGDLDGIKNEIGVYRDDCVCYRLWHEKVMLPVVYVMPREQYAVVYQSKDLSVEQLFDIFNRKVNPYYIIEKKGEKNIYFADTAAHIDCKRRNEPSVDRFQLVVLLRKISELVEINEHTRCQLVLTNGICKDYQGVFYSREHKKFGIDMMDKAGILLPRFKEDYQQVMLFNEGGGQEFIPDGIVEVSYISIVERQTPFLGPKKFFPKGFFSAPETEVSLKVKRQVLLLRAKKYKDYF
ncbi:hypothetical protein [Endozoicomonas sp. Mp262]|uniref:hypothetical protein n=1 Tax=Endozoicomonas sp. Mp262 TaxID=2919499 RepID=UPI0021D806A3